MPARTLVTLAAVALLSLTGCGGDDPSSSSLSGPLEYERGGGIAGEAEKLIVRPDATGSFERQRGLNQEAKDVKLTASERDELAGLVEDSDFASVQSVKSEPMPDAYEYAISYGDHEVTWQADDTPEGLEDLQAKLADLAEKYG